MDEDHTDTTMEELPLRRPEAPSIPASKPTPVVGMNGNADPSLAPPLLGPYQSRLGQPSQDSATLSGSASGQEALQGGVASGSPSTKSEDGSESSFDHDSSADMDEAVVRGLPLSSLATGLCYDVRMRYHCEVRPKTDIHPEDPRRIYYIYMELCRAGLVDDPQSQTPLVKTPLSRIHARDATKEEIFLVHTPELCDLVESTSTMDDETLIEMEESRDSIYFCRLTWMASILSVGGAIETCRAVVSRKVKNAIAVIRPPGHHAEVGKAMGFCLFNNVCVAAKVCQRDFGEKCRKILILDWDVHHGNGVQKVFYNDPNVLYISLHVYADGQFYPGGDDGDADHCGADAGEGRNVNIPWASQGMGDGDYLYAFQQVVMPIASEFNPDFVIVSAGFDAAAGDELGGCFVTPACYAHMTHMLMSLAEGKVAVCLEGGYNFKSISKSALAVTRTLMGEPPDRLLETSPTVTGVETVRNVMIKQSKYWTCMYPKALTMKSRGERMHDFVRQYQAKYLYENYKMTSLFIFRTKLSRSFENQVLATPSYHTSVPLLFIFHDPPEISTIPDPVTNEIDLHNSIVTDGVKDYIRWAYHNRFSIIDVNIPKWITDDHDNLRLVDPREQMDRVSSTEQLATYLWENYIELSACQDMFFLGVGDAFQGLAHLLVQKETVYERVRGVVAFVANHSLRPVTSNTNHRLSKWFINNSLVFVSPNHQVWVHIDTGAKKASKRYGKLIRSTQTSLNEMMIEHFPRFKAWAAEKMGWNVDDDGDETEDELLPSTSATGTTSVVHSDVASSAAHHGGVRMGAVSTGMKYTVG